MPRRTIACMVLLASAACVHPRAAAAPEPAPADARTFVGCYQGRFTSGDDRGPLSFRLDSVAPDPNDPFSGFDVEGARRAQISLSIRGGTYWRVTSWGIQLISGDPLHRITLEITPRGGEMIGTARWSIDTLRNVPEQRFIATRVPCP